MCLKNHGWKFIILYRKQQTKPSQKKKKRVANKRPEPNGITGKLYQTYKEQLTAVLLKLFQRIEEEETHPKSSYEVTIPLIQRYYIK